MAIVQAPLTAAPTPPPRALRDTGIDFVRALCVISVVVLHALMVGVTVTDTAPVFANASEGTGWIAPLSWMLQVMPLFFVIGGFSGLIAYRRARVRAGDAHAFVAARLHRLVRPAILTIGVVAVALALLTVVGVPADIIATAGFRFGQPLWFLAVFLMCQALLPALVTAHHRAPFLAIGTLAAAAVTVDVLRAATGIEALGFLNLAFVWMTLQQLGFFFAEGRIDALSRRTRVIAGAGALALLIMTFTTGIYSPDLIANINPPTAALLLVGVIQTSALSLLRESIERLSRRPAATAFIAFVTPRTMSIYLWHMPILLAMAGATAVFSMTTGIALPAPSSVDWWATRPLWLAVVLGLTAVVAVLTARVENHAAPAFSGSSRRAAAAVFMALIGLVLLLWMGTSVATALIALALMIAALALTQTTRPRPVHGTPISVGT